MSQCSNQGWTREEVERLVRWMEENQELLKGKQSEWHKRVKVQVFGDEG